MLPALLSLRKEVSWTLPTSDKASIFLFHFQVKVTFFRIGLDGPSCITAIIAHTNSALPTLCAWIQRTKERHSSRERERNNRKAIFSSLVFFRGFQFFVCGKLEVVFPAAAKWEKKVLPIFAGRFFLCRPSTTKFLPKWECVLCANWKCVIGKFFFRIRPPLSLFRPTFVANDAIPGVTIFASPSL